MQSRGYRSIGLVTKREFRTTVNRRSFWLTTFLLPLALLLLNFSAQIIADPDGITSSSGSERNVVAVGYVDGSGILREIPPDVPGGLLQGYANEARAREALRSGEISEYYVIAGDYLDSGELSLVSKARRPLDGSDLSPLSEISPLLLYALNHNLTEGAPTAFLLTTPVADLEEESLAPPSESETTRESLAYAVPYATLLILYLVLVMTGGYMLTSVAREKENRTAEVLLSSIPARHLMTGKILGLTGVGLLQIAIWLGAGLLLLSQVENLMPDLGTYSLPSGFIPWTLAYFLLGFLLYSSIYAALGVMARTAREASQLTYVALVPLIIPLIVSGTLIEQPQGEQAIALSLFPLTSPVAMVTRLAADSVPVWQALLGLALLALAAWGAILVAARFFRVENLLSNRSFSWSGLKKELYSLLRPQSA